MQSTGKIIVAAIFVLGLQGSAFAAPRAKVQGDSALSVFDRRLTPKKLARVVSGLRRHARYTKQGEGWREFGFDKGGIETPSIENPISGRSVSGNAWGVLLDEQGDQKVLRRTRRGGLVIVETAETHWSGDLIQLTVRQERGAVVRELKAQVIVSRREQPTGPYGSVINVSTRQGRDLIWRHPGRFLPVIREALLQLAPVARRAARR